MRKQVGDVGSLGSASGKRLKGFSRRRKRSWAGLAAAAAAVAVIPHAVQADTVWVGTTGDWQNPANWSPEIPLSTDNADINNGGTAQIQSESGVAFSLSLGSSTGQTGNLQISTDGSLNVSNVEYVGISGTGTLTQNGGTNSTNTLVLGSSSGSNGIYDLSGTGSLATVQIGLGYLGGTAQFNQSGGTVTARQIDFGGPQATYTQTAGTATVGDLIIADEPSYTGTYNSTFNISGTAILSAGDEVVGFAGLGNINQSGGTNTSNYLALGDNYDTVGAYIQTAGTNTVSGTLTVGSDGSSGYYGLQGGQLTAAAIQVDSLYSYFVQTAGSLSFTTFTQSGGGVSLPLITLGTGQSGLQYSLTGGTLTAPTISVQSGGSFSMTGGALSCTNFYMSGGSATFPSGVLDSGTLAPYAIPTPSGVAPPTFNITGGQLYAINEYLGQNGGSVSYTQSAASTPQVTTNLFVANTNTSVATYNLNGSTLTATSEYVGYLGTGALVQTGGANAATALQIGNGSATGSYALIAGTAAFSGDATVVSGGLTITGGAMTISGTLTIDSGPNNNVTLMGSNASLSVGSLDTKNSPSSFIFGGPAATLSITGTAGLTVGPGGPLGSSLSLTAGETLNVLSAMINNGVFTVGNGTGVSAANVGGIAGSGTTTIGSGSSLRITPHSNATTRSSQTSVTITGTGIMDITDNPMTINYGTNHASPVATIGGYISNGYNGGLWNGPGINSSMVASVNAAHTNSHLYAIGYADASDPAVAKDGFTPGTVVIEPAIVGDANLDGVVNYTDFQLLAANFNGVGTSWDQGNFNYGAGTSYVDFQLLAANFNDSTSLDNAEFDAMNAVALSHGETLVANPDGDGFSFVSVPEPASVGMIGIAIVGVMGRRRRKR